MSTLQQTVHVALIGTGATAILDGWLWLLARLGLPVSDWGLVGRWVGHLARGRFAHAAIAKAAPVAHESAVGWSLHYATGITLAAAMVGIAGIGWIRQPTAAPALAFGIATVVLPLFVMQPAMGAGIAASRTPAPLKNVLRSVTNHAVFGVGLYLAAAALARATA